MKVELTGDEALRASLGRLSDDLADTGGMLREVAVQVARDAKALAPKRTGALAASIGVQRFHRGHIVQTSLPYAAYVSYGSVHNPRPRPFLDMAARKAERQAPEAVERAVSAAIGRSGL